jgi:peptide/nickel transport system permease protein
MTATPLRSAPASTEAVPGGGEVAAPLPARRRDRYLVTGTAIIVAYAAVALMAPLLAPFDPDDGDVLHRLAPPDGSHWLGTDQSGRDVLSRLIFAVRIDLPLGFLLALLPTVVGTALGVLAGYFGRFVDAAVMRTSELVQAFPFYVLIMALVAVFEPGVGTLVVVFVMIGWVPSASLTRAELLRVREQEYMQAAVLSGLPRRRVLFRHALPNALDPVLAYFPADVMFAVGSLAGLSFLGVGLPPSIPELGAMISDGQPYATTHWWLVVAPGITLALLGLGLVLVGDALAQRLGQR